MQILIATTNPGKVREFRHMLGENGRQFTDLSAFPNVRQVPETGQTFAENAALKASGYATQCNSWALADDSGLVVDALDGKPGIYSARWAIMHSRGQGDAANNELLLEQMRDVPDEKRTARFVCALVLADDTGRILATTQGHVAGRLLRQPRGSNGFGYDPIFFIPSLNRSAAELTPQQKSQISHRANALKKMQQWLNGSIAAH